MAFYTLVNDANIIYQAMIWDDGVPTTELPGYRWLPDNPPTATQFQVIGRVEPVAVDATEIEYTLTDLPLNEMVLIRQAMVNVLRDQKIDNGVTYDANLYDSDAISRMNLTATLASVNAGISLPAGFTWRTADDVNVSHDAASLTALAEVMLTHANGCYANSWTHKDAISILTTRVDIEGYDDSVGWPV